MALAEGLAVLRKHFLQQLQARHVVSTVEQPDADRMVGLQHSLIVWTQDVAKQLALAAKKLDGPDEVPLESKHAAKGAIPVEHAASAISTGMWHEDELRNGLRIRRRAGGEGGGG